MSEPHAGAEIENQTEMTSSPLFHKALRTVQDSSNPMGDLWPSPRRPTSILSLSLSHFLNAHVQEAYEHRQNQLQSFIYQSN